MKYEEIKLAWPVQNIFDVKEALAKSVAHCK